MQAKIKDEDNSEKKKQFTTQCTELDQTILSIT